MPEEILYLWGATLVFVLFVWGYVRRLRRREQTQPVEVRNGRSSWLSRLQSWLLADPDSNAAIDVPSKMDEGQTAVSPLPPLPESFTLAQIRYPAAALLFGGLLIVLAGLVIKGKLFPDEERWAWWLIGLGSAAFVLAGQLINQRKLPAWVVRQAYRFSRYFNLTPLQLVLLGWAPIFALLASLAAGNLLQARQGTVATIAWLLAVGLVIAGSWVRGEQVKLKIVWGEMLFLAVLFALALALRGTNLEGIPNTLSGDEAASGLVALAFRQGEANNLFTFGWFSFPSLYFVIQSLGIRFWGQTTEALRITSAVGGALAVLALYWLAKVMFDRFTAVLAAVYLTASHYHIHMSRNGLNNIWDSLFGTLAIMGLWHGWKTGRRSSFILTGVALGLGQYFYVSIRALPIIFLVWAVTAFWRDRVTFYRRLPGLILAAFIAFIIILPFGIQAAQHWDNFMAPYGRVSVFANDWLDQVMAQTGETAVQVITGQMLTTAMGFTHEPLRLLYNPGSALLLGGAAALFLIGVFWAVMHFDLKYWLLFLPMIMVILTGGFSHNPPASQRYILAMPLVAMILVFPLRLSVDWLQALWPRAKPVLILSVSLILVAVVWGDLHYYFFEVYDTYVLGGTNTEAATQIAYYLREQENPEQQVYFFGFPRMGYFSLATIQFLAPKMIGEDVVDPLQAPPDWNLDGQTQFIFLPERLIELEQIQMSYPGGQYHEIMSDKGGMLFAVYEIVPPVSGS
jgi:4-amino-4-deoxy-L-arabinose transferase-like glycosyltransferase